MFKFGDLAGAVTRWTSSTSTRQLDDEDSLGPQSISYEVNMGTPEKNKSGSPNGGKRGGRGGARARSTSKNRNSSSGTDWMDKIDRIWQLCSDTKQEVTQITAKLEKATNDIGEVKSAVKEVEERMNEVESETKTLTEKVESFEKHSQELEQRLEEKLMAKLTKQIPPERQQAKLRQPEKPFIQMVSLSPKTGGSKPFPFKPLPSSQLLTKKNSASFYQPPSKHTSGHGDLRGVHKAFEELLQDQEARKNSFLVGEVERKAEDGVQLRPAIPYSQVVRESFDGVRYKLGPLSTARSNGLKLGKVFVHPEDVHLMKLRCRDTWRATREMGWWIGQENPADLRRMEVNAFRFIMEAKNTCVELKRYYIEAEEGFIRYARVPFLPVFLVPEDQEKWPELAPILGKMVQSIQSKNWVTRFRGVKKLDPRLLEEWNSVSGTLDVSSSEDSEHDGEESDDLRVGNKLTFLGRVTRKDSNRDASSPKIGSQEVRRPSPSRTVTGLDDGGADAVGDGVGTKADVLVTGERGDGVSVGSGGAVNSENTATNAPGGPVNPGAANLAAASGDLVDSGTDKVAIADGVTVNGTEANGDGPDDVMDHEEGCTFTDALSRDEEEENDNGDVHD